MHLCDLTLEAAFEEFIGFDAFTQAFGFCRVCGHDENERRYLRCAGRAVIAVQLDSHVVVVVNRVL